MKEVRINIQNKDLWQKEARLYRRWSRIIRVLIVVVILWLALIIPLVHYRDTGIIPKWVGWAHIIMYFVLLFADILAITKLKIHSWKWYEYKFGKKH